MLNNGLLDSSKGVLPITISLSPPILTATGVLSRDDGNNLPLVEGVVDASLRVLRAAAGVRTKVYGDVALKSILEFAHVYIEGGLEEEDGLTSFEGVWDIPNPLIGVAEPDLIDIGFDVTVDNPNNKLVTASL